MNVEDFDLTGALKSGQSFAWQQILPGTFRGIVGTVPCLIRQSDERQLLVWTSDLDAVCSYLALDHCWAEIADSFSKEDRILQEALVFARGLRILRQPLWECLAMFLCSSLKQVVHIQQIGQALRQTYGEPLCAFGHRFYTFPTAEVLAAAGEPALRGLKLGYRAKHLAALSTFVSENPGWLEALAGMSTKDAQSALETLPGVGTKIAQCVCLFALEKLEAFPIDVWMERVLKHGYGRRKMRGPSLQKFVRQHFGPYAGYAQQVLFHHARLSKGQSLGMESRSGGRSKRS
ncbi:MAG: DNA glycosylase [Verrucomicrobiales bacterium]